jgi:hypothetical protein
MGALKGHFKKRTHAEPALATFFAGGPGGRAPARAKGIAIGSEYLMFSSHKSTMQKGETREMKLIREMSQVQEASELVRHGPT